MNGVNGNAQTSVAIDTVQMHLRTLSRDTLQVFALFTGLLLFAGVRSLRHLGHSTRMLARLQ